MDKEAKRKGGRPADGDFGFISNGEPKEKYDVGAKSTAPLPTGSSILLRISGAGYKSWFLTGSPKN